MAPNGSAGRHRQRKLERMIPASQWRDNGDGTAWVVPARLRGRHTFTVEVETGDFQCPSCRASFSLPLGMTCDNHSPERIITALRVSVVPGMVLPIVSDVDPAFVQREEYPLIVIDIMDRATLHLGPDIADIEDITLPPAAKPGMYAVLLAVQS